MGQGVKSQERDHQTKRVNYATNNKLLLRKCAEKEREEGEKKRKSKKPKMKASEGVEQRQHLWGTFLLPLPPHPLSAAHACDPNQLRERKMMKFSAFEAN